MKELGITKGKCFYEKGVIRTVNTNIGSIYQTFHNQNEAKSNADLITDTFNTAQKTGLLPSELLERYNGAIEALKGIERECDNQNSSHENIWRIAYGLLEDQEQTISKANRE